MKKTLFLLLILLCSTPLIFTACSEDNERQPLQPGLALPAPPYTLILNQGNQTAKIPGSCTLLSGDGKKLIQEPFLQINGRAIGEAPQEGVVCGSKLYLALYGSNLVQVVDVHTLRLLASIPTAAPEGITAHDGKVYVTNNDGFVSRIDTLSLTITGHLAVGPNPVGIIPRGENLYVAISDGYNYAQGYKDGFKVVKIDIARFATTGEIRVGMNPSRFTCDADGRLFVTCLGDYARTPAQIWRIDIDDRAAVFATGSMATAFDHRLYVIHSVTDWTTNQTSTTYQVLDTRSGNALPSTFGTVSTPLDPIAIATQPKTGHIFITSRSTLEKKVRFTTPGHLYRYTSDGLLIGQYATGIEPYAVVFTHS